MKVFIYGLFDPREPHELRVIGKTKNSLQKRLRDYVGKARRDVRLKRPLTPAHAWVFGMLKQDVRPSIRLIETCDGNAWRQRERRAITLHRNNGQKLLNKRRGGDGPEDGETKRFCSTCGTRKRTTASGNRYCPKCSNSSTRKFRKSPKGRAYRHAYRRTWYKTPDGLAQSRGHALDWYYRNRETCLTARKLGITVTEYRARLAV